MNDDPGCPLNGDSYVGELGSANENCCYCFSNDVVTPSLCEGSTPGWTDVWGDGCEWYEANDQPGCPKYGMNWEGDMGLADNCCFCNETAVVTNSTGGVF